MMPPLEKRPSSPVDRVYSANGTKARSSSGESVPHNALMAAFPVQSP